MLTSRALHHRDPSVGPPHPAVGGKPSTRLQWPSQRASICRIANERDAVERHGWSFDLEATGFVISKRRIMYCFPRPMHLRICAHHDGHASVGLPDAVYGLEAAS
nr:hypothetical protein CFP56_36329 [Quercus suber]